MRGGAIEQRMDGGGGREGRVVFGRPFFVVLFSVLFRGLGLGPPQFFCRPLPVALGTKLAETILILWESDQVRNKPVENAQSAKSGGNLGKGETAIRLRHGDIKT